MIPTNNITCPNCGTQIDIEELLEHDIEARLKAEFSQRLENEKHRIALAAKTEAEESLKPQLVALQEENKARTEQLRKLQNAELEQQRLQIQLTELKESQEFLVEQKLIQEREKLLADERVKEQQRLEHAEQRAAQKLNEERLAQQQLLQSEILKVQTQALLRERDLQQQLDATRKAAEELERRAKQGSQQLQGESLELEVEKYLREQFIYDRVDAIAKGQTGADCLHVVHRGDRICGNIYYETKRTKAFSSEWISKLKADLRDKGADIGVIVTETMPKDMQRFGQKEGIWICTFQEFKALCFVLRELILRVSDAQAAQQNKGDKNELVV